MIIFSLQKTPLNDHAALNIFAKCDDVMKLLIKELGYDIPEWRLTRYFEVNINDKDVFTVSGVDQRGSPYSLFKNVECPAASKTNRSSDQSYAF